MSIKNKKRFYIYPRSRKREKYHIDWDIDNKTKEYIINIGGIEVARRDTFPEAEKLIKELKTEVKK